MSSLVSQSQAVVPAVKTIAVKVDGRLVEPPQLTPHPITGRLVPTTMIQACELAKVTVPHYCYHPKLPVAGNCRMCLVEYGTPAFGPDRKPLLNTDGTPVITKAPNPAIACATPITPGMEIYTNTPGVKRMRKAVLEFLLINHPLDCPICDQAGECKLQEYSVEYGQAESRFVETKVRKPKQVELGPRIMLDDERCILCSRCIRFTRDLVGDDALGIIDRGSHSTLTHYPGKPFDNNYTLNTVDLCPVGALTSKDFRFQMRVWFLKETKSICPSCGTGCNIIVGSREDRVYRYVPRSNDAVNACWMCDAGRLNYQWIGRPDRLVECGLRQPQLGLRKSQWPEALQAAAEHLKAVPSGSVAIIGSARQTNEELFLLHRLAQKLGAITDSIPRWQAGDKLLVQADMNPNTTGAQLLGIAGQPLGRNLARIAEGITNGQIRVLISIGEELTRHFGYDLLAKLETLFVGDLLPNNTTGLAHIVFPGCAPAEKRGTFTNLKGRVQKFMKAVEPPGQARPEWEYLTELTEQVTGEKLPHHIEGLFNLMSQETPGFKGLTWSKLGDTGAVVQTS